MATSLEYMALHRGTDLATSGESSSTEDSSESDDAEESERDMDCCHLTGLPSMEIKEKDIGLGAAYSPEERQKHLKFFNTMSRGQKALFVRCCEPIPLDSMGGLMHPGEVLYKRKRWFPPWAIIIAGIVLNVSASIKVCYHSRTADSFTFGSKSDRRKTILFEHYVKVCGAQYNATTLHEAPADDVHCILHPLKRLVAHKNIHLFECIVLVIMTTWLLIIWALYWLGFDGVLERAPGVLIFFPKVAAKFSTMSLLQLFSWNRLRSLMHGEARLIWTIFWETMLCMRNEPDVDNIFDEGAAHKKRRFHHGDKVRGWREWMPELMLRGFVLLSWFVCVSLGFQALLVKLTAIHFASVSDFSSWNLDEWFLVAAFVNQVYGIYWVDELEFYSVMMFKFCGSDATWNQTECRVSAEYLRALAQKVGQGYLADAFLARIKVLGVLANVDANGLQQLLLSPEREKYLVDRRKKTFDFYDAIYNLEHDMNFQENHLKELYLKELGVVADQQVKHTSAADLLQAAYITAPLENIDEPVKKLGRVQS